MKKILVLLGIALFIAYMLFVGNGANPHGINATYLLDPYGDMPDSVGTIHGYDIVKKKVPGINEEKFQELFRKFNKQTLTDGIVSYREHMPDVLVAYDGGYVSISLNQREAVATEGTKRTVYSINEETRDELIKLLLWQFPLDKYLMKSL